MASCAGGGLWVVVLTSERERERDRERERELKIIIKKEYLNEGLK